MPFEISRRDLSRPPLSLHVPPAGLGHSRRRKSSSSLCVLPGVDRLRYHSNKSQNNQKAPPNNWTHLRMMSWLVASGDEVSSAGR